MCWRFSFFSGFMDEGVQKGNRPKLGEVAKVRTRDVGVDRSGIRRCTMDEARKLNAA